MFANCRSLLVEHGLRTKRLKRICVFCGSSVGARPAYLAVTRRLGELLAERGIGLVCGGGRVWRRRLT